jgi:hypothetical protein
MFSLLSMCWVYKYAVPRCAESGSTSGAILLFRVMSESQSERQGLMVAGGNELMDVTVGGEGIFRDTDVRSEP